MGYRRITTVLGALLTAVCVPVLITVLASMAWAQTGRGTIQGFITDSSGARVPGAQIQLVQMDTNSAYDRATNDEGLYIVQSLPIGNYRVVVKKPGFENYVREPILVRAGVVTQVDLTLSPGAASETVTVTGEAPVLDLSTTSTPTSVDAETVEALPIIAGGAKRNISQLLRYLPGLTSYDPNNREDATWNPRLYGSAGGQTQTFIDGGAGSGISTGKGALEEVGPAIETVAEFSVVANSFNAEYGGFGSWFTTVQIKSGANAVHGSVYNHYVNNALNARSFFQKSIASGNQNEGGVTLGGPIILPKIYNGRNKTFFFVSEAIYVTRNGPSYDLRTIPMAAFKTGDFSGFTSAGALLPIFDPATTVPDGKGSFVRTAFPGNIIPADRITAPSKKIIAFMPDPDIPGALTQNFYSRAFSGKFWPYFNNYVTTVKVDHSLSTKQKLSVLYTNQIRHRQLQGENVGWFLRIPWGAEQTNPLDFINFQVANSWRVRVNHDYVLRPSMLNHLTISVDRYINLGANATAGGGWNKKLGLGAGMPVDNGSFSPISFSGGTASSMGMGRGYHNLSYETRSGIDESLSWIRGTHSLKFGVNYSRVAVNSINLGSAAGSYSFSNAQTSQPNAGTNLARWGSSFASFLLGAVNSASVTMTDMTGTRSPSTGIFAQDEWHATPKLTLSLGLRWDYRPPNREVNNKESNMDSTLPNPGAGNLPGALAFRANHGPFQKTWKRGFAPRLGAAYQLGARTVVRASAGIYYAGGGYGVSTTGFTSSPSFSGGDGFSPVYYWNTGSFPQNFLRPPIMDPTFSNGQGATERAADGGKLTQITSWNFGVQRAIGKGTSLDATYLGSSTTHSGQNWAYNTLDIKYLALQSMLLQPINSPTAIAAGYKEPFPGFVNQTGANTVAASLRRFPQYTSASLGGAPTGRSSMHSLQLKGEQRLSNGLSFNGFFTWMKVLSKGFGQYPLGPQEWSLDGSSVPAVFGLTWTYKLPFGHGGKIANWSNPVAQRIVSGWAVNGFVRYQSGQPLGVGTSNTLSALGYSKRANLVSGKPLTLVTNPRDFEPSRDRYVNVAAFESPGQWEFGNLPASMDWLRGFTSKAESLQIAKDTRFTERVGLNLMFDLSNPFNFHRWTNPGASLSSLSTFGQVTGAGEGRSVQISATISF